MQEIDARGQACPAPVLQTKAILEENNPGDVSVVVDNAAAQQNVQRFLESRGFLTSLAENDGDYFVTGSCDTLPSIGPKPSSSKKTEGEKIMILCATDRIGFGDDELGLKLMVNFIRTLKEMGNELWQLVFVNNGVKLAVEGSEVVADLQNYEKEGIKILVCGTCLNHFNLLEKKQVGETTNMLDIVMGMQAADKVISV